MSRYGTTMTVLASTITTSWEVPLMRKKINLQELKKSERTMMEILMHWLRNKRKKQKLWYPWPQQTEHSVKLETNNIRYECHVVMFLSNIHSEIVRPTRRPERKCVICNGAHWASWCREKQGKPKEQKGEATAHTAHSEFAMTVHTETSVFASVALENGKAWIDCGANEVCGSWKHWMVWHVLMSSDTVQLVFHWIGHRRCGALLQM